MNRTKSSFTFLLMLFMLNNRMNAQSEVPPQTKNLYEEIYVQDSIMFTAFNNKNIEQFKKMFTDDLEFFHDKGGLTSYDHTINFLKKLAEEKSDLKRELIAASLEVYPIPGYGAMEIGQHRFTHTENGKAETAIFKFVQVWQQKDGAWQVSRVVSYGH